MLLAGDHDQQGQNNNTPQQKSFSRQVLPIRLIDIPATIGSLSGGIHFMVPLDWSFHVISHTWSLEVRKFSEQIGQQILELNHGADDHRDFADYSSSSSSYNSYFRQVDLRGKPAYNELIEFLSMLAEDGVAYAWFDALCINQTDKREKSKEIANMGAYYSNSQGCYVLVHGIGRGYSLWGLDHRGHVDTGRIPRWFERVWTLQEFVLPRRLTFLSQLSQRVHKIVNGLISKANYSIGFCTCCILKDIALKMPPRGLWRERLEFLRSSGMDVEVHIDESSILHEDLFPGLNSDETIWTDIDRQSACPTCGTQSLMRRVQRQGSLYHSGTATPNSVNEEIYMVERDAYLFLLYLDTFFPLNCSYASMTRIFELSRSCSTLAEQIIWDPWRVVFEIGKRECTHEEDRVLGILGLLGVGGEMQVRTDESLEQQLVHLGRYCKSADPDLLLKMCLVQQGGGSQPGISWAPSLCNTSGGGEVCGLSFDRTTSAFLHHPGGPGQCCRHLVPGEDVLPQPLDLSKLETSMANVVSNLSRLSHFQRKVDILDCSARGIMLEARAVAGRVMSYATLLRKDQAAVKEGMMQDTTESAWLSEGTSTIEQEQEESLPFQLWKMQGGVIESPTEHTPTHCIYFEESGIFLPLIVTLYGASTRPGYLEPAIKMADAVRPWNMMGVNLGGNGGAGEALEGVSVVGGHRLEDGRLRIEMEVWLLWLGSVGEERTSNANCIYDVAIVCLGRKTSDDDHLEELHKVGLFVLPRTVGNAIFSLAGGSKLGAGSNRSRYLLGGFGKDLSSFARVSLVQKSAPRAADTREMQEEDVIQRPVETIREGPLAFLWRCPCNIL